MEGIQTGTSGSTECRVERVEVVKKKKMKWIGGLLVLCLMAEPGAIVTVQAESEAQKTESTELEPEVSAAIGISESDKDDEAAEETEIQPGERTATIMVVSITGNELTYYEVEDETETEAESEETEQSETDVNTETESEELESSADADKKMETAEIDTRTDDAETEDTEGTSVQKDSGMTPPDRMQQGDGMPQGDSSTTPPDGAPQCDGGASGMPENMPSGDFQKGGRAEQQNTKTVYLPVPVVVHTDTDEKRTFSILEAGDRLQVTIVTDEEGNETITEIWMLKE